MKGKGGRWWWGRGRYGENMAGLSTGILERFRIVGECVLGMMS